MCSRTLLLLLSLIFLVACQPAGKADGFSPLFPIHPTPTSAPLVEPSPSPIHLERPQPTAALPPTTRPPARAWSWQPIGNLPRADVRDVYYTGALLTWTQKVWKSATAASDVQYVLRGDQKEVRYETPGDSKIEMARMAGGRLALLETTPNQPAVIRLFDLQTGDEWYIGARDGEFTNPKYPPYLGIDENYLVWNSIKADGRTCLRMYIFETGSFTDLLCTERAMNFLRARYIRWPVVTYDRSITGKDVEFSMHGIYQNTGPVSTLNCSTGPDSSDGLVLGCLGKDPEPGSGIPTNGEEALAFDPTLQVCDGRAFWVWNDSQVRSWVPGGAEEVIYRSLGASEQIRGIRCTDGWVTLVLSGAETGQNSLEVWAAPISD